MSESPIKKIVIEVAGVEIALDPKDAKVLYRALDEIYGSKGVQYIPQPYPVPVATAIWQRPYIHWTSTTGGISAGLASDSNSIRLLSSLTDSRILNS